MPNRPKRTALDTARQAVAKGARKQRKAFLTRLQLPATKEVKKKLAVMKRYGVYAPKWDTSKKGNWTTARVREIERRFNRFQGDAKITISHRGYYPFQRGEKGWKLSSQFRFRRTPVNGNFNVRRIGITNTSKGAFVPKALGRVYVTPKGEVFWSAKHGKSRGGKKTYTLDAEQTLRVLHYVSESPKARRKKEHTEGAKLYKEIFQGIERGDTIYSIDFFGTTFDVGSESDLKRFANQYGPKISRLPGGTLGAFTVERYRVAR